MKEIEIGEYVRSKKGVIAKIQAHQELKIYDNKGGNAIFLNYETDRGTLADIDIAKHSKNIIDLIETGDYVNEEHVLCFRNRDCDYDIGTEYNDDFGVYFGYDKEDLKSIVTKEQFKNMEYKLEV